MTSSRTIASPFNLLPVALTGALCALGFGPVFGGWPGYLAAGGGVLLGLVLAWISAGRWGVALTTAAGIIIYIAFVGVLALPDTTIAGFLPSLETVQRGTLLVVQSWRDLLTVAVPAGVFSGPAVVPMLSALICSTAAGRLALTRRWYALAGVPMLVLLLVAILWGTSRAPLGGWIGFGFVIVLLGWIVIRQAHDRAVAHELSGFDTARARSWTRLLSAALVLAVSAGVAVMVSPMITGADRVVLRRFVEPPLDLRNYASPLMSYRYLEVDQKLVTQFTVHGLPEGSRLRLATLDTYDGVVYNVAADSAEFVRAGADIEPRRTSEDQASAMTMQVSIDGYRGVWLPGGGDLRGVTFNGANAADQTKTLYYNEGTGTALVTAGLEQGDDYQVQIVTPPPVDRATLADHGIEDVAVPSTERVPDAVLKKTAEIVAGAATSVDQVLAIEKALQEGYYSDGSDGQSMSGHSEARIESLLSLPEMVGDDEQYAVAMGLMLDQLGIPSRVVLGFYPSDGSVVPQRWEALGTDAHVWVEVPFNDLGWVSFDPTPDRDRRPETTVPKPNPKPRPQVQPPPVPPQEPPEAPMQLSDDESDQDDGWQIPWEVIKAIAAALGIGALAASPFLLIAALRGRRRRLRREAELPADRLSGGWAEIVDTATDLGIRVDALQTRREQASELAARVPDADIDRLAAAIDYGVFGDGTPREAYIDQIWATTALAASTMRASAGRWRRLAYFATPVSLARPAISGPLEKPQPIIRRLLGRKP